MWAYRLVTPGLFDIVGVPAPRVDTLAPAEVLLRTLAGGICGSDIPKLRGQAGVIADDNGRMLPGPPGFPMHEVVGEVVASRHEAVRPGAYVVGWATHSDALAEMVVTNGEHLYSYDAGLTPTEAVIIQPLACVLEALERVAVAGKTVGIIGLGPIGLLFAHAVKAARAGHVIGIDPVDRSAVATCMGIDELITAPSRTWAKGLAAHRRPDLVIEAAGHQVTTLDDAINAVGVGGSIFYFGIPDNEYYPLNMERMLRKHLTLMAGVTRDRRSSLVRAGDYLARHPEVNDQLVTHRFDRHSAQSAFDTAAVAHVGRLKVVVSLTD